MTPTHLTLAAIGALAAAGAVRRRGSISSSPRLIPEVPEFQGIRERMDAKGLTIPFAHADALRELNELFGHGEDDDEFDEDPDLDGKGDLAKITATGEEANPPPRDDAPYRDWERWSDRMDQYTARRKIDIVAALDQEMNSIPRGGPTFQQKLQRDQEEAAERKKAQFWASDLGREMAEATTRQKKSIAVGIAQDVARHTNWRLKDMASELMPPPAGLSDQQMKALYTRILAEVTRKHGDRVRREEEKKSLDFYGQ